MRHIPRLMTGALLLVLAAGTTATHAQTIVRHPAPDEALRQRWDWGLQEAERRCPDGCWIGYGIRRRMSEKSYMGSYGHDDGRPTLQMLIYGREVEPVPDDRPSRRTASSREVEKEIAVLFRVDDGAVREVNLSNISLSVRLGEQPLLWLGRADQPASLTLIEQQYSLASSVDVKEELVMAVGLHDAEDRVVPFLTDVLTGPGADDVRGQAAFWLAEQEVPGVLPVLERVARRDASEEVREQAVFGLSRIETDDATEVLIDLARHLENRETREQAIFWLGQKASDRAVAGLAAIVEDDPDVEVKKKAVFSLSQLDADEAVPRLISIATTHAHPEVRREAIFWLGQTNDSRAVDALVEIVRGP